MCSDYTSQYSHMIDSFKSLESSCSFSIEVEGTVGIRAAHCQAANGKIIATRPRPTKSFLVLAQLMNGVAAVAAMTTTCRWSPSCPKAMGRGAK